MTETRRIIAEASKSGFREKSHIEGIESMVLDVFNYGLSYGVSEKNPI